MKKHIGLKEIRQILSCQLPKLRKDYHVESLEIFGSRRWGDNRPDSDLDILVTFSSPPSLFEFVRLKNHLSELLGVEVDLVMRNALKPHIGEQILKEAVPV
ncbi:MAG: nucleotidyltransferase family protein [Thermodesulfobacteria bacterium]|nr:nucleotidyltransferase family protein [Thermodesulfobacteriota bacterium]